MNTIMAHSLVIHVVLPFGGEFMYWYYIDFKMLGID